GARQDPAGVVLGIRALPCCAPLCEARSDVPPQSGQKGQCDLSQRGGREVMAYDGTRVSISDSQSGIRRMVYAHKGTGVSFVSQPPREGFEALITLNNEAYHIRVMATCKKVSERD